MKLPKYCNVTSESKTEKIKMYLSAPVIHRKRSTHRSTVQRSSGSDLPSEEDQRKKQPVNPDEDGMAISSDGASQKPRQTQQVITPPASIQKPKPHADVVMSPSKAIRGDPRSARAARKHGQRHTHQLRVDDKKLWESEVRFTAILKTGN